MRLLSRLPPALLLTFPTTFAFAIPNTFTGTGNWSDASKWSLGVPYAVFGGDGQVTLNAGTLAAGSYNYSLWIGNEQVDTKQMLIVR